jgi:hypothetical protein
MYLMGTATAQMITENYATRLNYGVAAVRIIQVCVATGYVTHISHLPLPKRGATISRASTGNDSLCTVCCDLMEPLENAVRRMTNSMGASVTSLVTKTYDLIPEIIPEQRGSRGVIDRVGSAISWLFGVSTSSDVESLQKEIEHIKVIAGSSAADETRMKDSMISFTKLSYERLGELHQILSEDHHTIVSIVQTVSGAKETLNHESSAIAFMASELNVFTRVHDAVQRLEQGVEALVTGQLTPQLV